MNWPTPPSSVSTSQNLEVFQKYLYRYLLDFTKEKARMDILANKKAGAFEAYRVLLHKAVNASDERALDIEARVLIPRRAKSEKDIVEAFQG